MNYANLTWKCKKSVLRQGFTASSGPIKIKKGDIKITDGVETADCLNGHFINLRKRIGS